MAVSCTYFLLVSECLIMLNQETEDKVRVNHNEFGNVSKYTKL